MPADPSEIAVFLAGYATACDVAGVEPLPVRELAQLLEMVVAGARSEPSAWPLDS